MPKSKTNNNNSTNSELKVQNRQLMRLVNQTTKLNNKLLQAETKEKSIAENKRIRRMISRETRRESRLSRVNMGMTNAEKAFAAAYLDPNHDNQVTRCNGIPDHASKIHGKYTKSFDVTFKPDANKNLVLYLLPFAECPGMVYDTATQTYTAIRDPLLPEDYFKTNGVYAFRCFGQGMTVSNASSPTTVQGTVCCARIPAIIDNHAATESTGSNLYGTCYLRCIEGLPNTYDEISSSVVNPYIANAAYGAYMVNRNQNPDFPYVYRSTDWDKSTTSIYHYTDSGNILAEHDPEDLKKYKNYNILTVLSKSETASPGAVPNIVRVDKTQPANLLTNSISVTGINGTGFMVCCCFMQGLNPDNAINVKICHGYELLLKPNSSLLAQAVPPLIPSNYILEAVARECATRNYQALVSSANFWGEIWNGFKKVIQSVKPLTAEVVKLLPSSFQSIGKAAATSLDNLTSDGTAYYSAPASSQPGIATPFAVATVRDGRRRQ